MTDKIFYNESSSQSLGWSPDWLGASDFDDDLIKRIVAFQKKHGLKADGLLGPGTYRRLWTEREAEIETYVPSEINSNSENYLIYNNNYVPIEWDRVVLPFNRGGLKHTNGYKKMIEKRNISMFVTHWDVCLNAKSCFKVLNNTKRKASVHFAIDNDGTIYQFLDMNHIAWHASKRAVNEKSVGVEISNAYYPKYQSWYKRNGFGERPLITDATVHGKPMEEFMGFYPVQVDALKALYKSMHQACGIPYETPDGDSTVRSVTSGKYKGFVHHYNVVKNKIDCAGLDIKKIMEDLKNGK
tara:strand:- start:2412 stop:3305 length:894 start_codon:yes stop_codon:yes gene_type:complete